MRILYFLTLFLLLGNISLKAQQNYKIGDIYTFDDNTKGIVFYVDTDGHGLVVSMEQEKGRWEEESNYVYCQDIVNIPNEELPCLEYNQGLGMIYTSYILEQLGNVKPIAAKYSRNKGVDWYLPSAAEMYQLMIANKDKTIDNCLKENDCKKISNWYWTSSEHSAGDAWRINKEGKLKRSSKLAFRYVKAVRKF